MGVHRARRQANGIELTAAHGFLTGSCKVRKQVGASGLVGLHLHRPITDKHAVEAKAGAAAAEDAEFPFARVTDALRCQYICETGAQILEVMRTLEATNSASVVHLRNYFADVDVINNRRLEATLRVRLPATSPPRTSPGAEQTADVGGGGKMATPELYYSARVEILLRDLYVCANRIDCGPLAYFHKVFPETRSARGRVLINDAITSWSRFFSVPVLLAMYIRVLKTFFANLAKASRAQGLAHSQGGSNVGRQLQELPAEKPELYALGLDEIVEHKLKQVFTASAAAGASAAGTAVEAQSHKSKAEQWHRPIAALLAAVGFANQCGANMIDGSVRCHFTLQDMRRAVGAKATRGLANVAGTGLALVEQLVADYSPNDAYRVPTLKIIRGGAGGDGASCVPRTLQARAPLYRAARFPRGRSTRRRLACANASARAGNKPAELPALRSREVAFCTRAAGIHAVSLISPHPCAWCRGRSRRVLA